MLHRWTPEERRALVGHDAGEDQTLDLAELRGQCFEGMAAMAVPRGHSQAVCNRGSLGKVHLQ